MCVNLTGKLEVCESCAISKSKVCAFINKTYTRASKPVDIIFVDATGPFPESLIGNRYCIGVVDNYSRYFCSFFTKTNLQLLNNTFFKNMTSRGTPVKCICLDNTV